MILAHVKWFVDESSLFEPAITGREYLLVILFVLIGLIVLVWIDKLLKSLPSLATFSDRLQGLRPWMPTIVRVSLAIMLIYASVNRYVLAPNLPASTNPENLLLIASSLVAVLLLLGLATRFAALGLATIWLFSIFVFDLGSIIDHFEVLGMSAFLMIEGSGKLAFDNSLGINWRSPKKYRVISLKILLVSAGISLAVLAFSEKLFNLPVAMSFLENYDWNFLSSFGVSDRSFVLFIGASELLIGLALMLGLANRLIVLILLVLLATTAALLGIDEVVGHAFAVSVVFAAWINIDLPLMKTKLK